MPDEVEDRKEKVAECRACKMHKEVDNEKFPPDKETGLCTFHQNNPEIFSRTYPTRNVLAVMVLNNQKR